MKLFDMSENDIQRAVDAHNDYLFDLFYEADEPPRSCENCEYYYGGACGIAEAEYSEEELEAMSDDDYKALIERNPDDYCDDHKWEER